MENYDLRFLRNFLRTMPYCISPSGQFAICNDSTVRNDGMLQTITLIDRYFDNKFLLHTGFLAKQNRDPRVLILCISVTDDLKVVLMSQNRLIWSGVQFLRIGREHERVSDSYHHLIAAFSLDNSGHFILTCQNIGNITYCIRDYRDAKEKRLSTFEMPILLTTAKFAKDRQFLLVLAKFQTLFAIVDVNNGTILRKHLCAAVPLPFVRCRSTYRHFMDIGAQVQLPAIHKSSGVVRPGKIIYPTEWHPLRREVNEEYLDEIIRNVCIVCEQPLTRRKPRIYAPKSIRRPVSLLLSAHYATLNSGRQFELPLCRPIIPLDGPLGGPVHVQHPYDLSSKRPSRMATRQKRSKLSGLSKSKTKVERNNRRPNNPVADPDWWICYRVLFFVITFCVLKVMQQIGMLQK